MARPETGLATPGGPVPQATRGFAILRGDVTDAAHAAAEAERLGYHAAWSPEFYTRSAIVSLAAMAQVTSTTRIGSSIAYAVGRTPLVLATEARSLDELSAGRLIYGLGTGTTKMMAGWHGVDPAPRPGWRSSSRCCAACGGCTRDRCVTTDGFTTSM
jgi:alkanesulfonate monooxygenase SsuD/methylene tetrahydromethanopterin reductase-like flavin-dependent oxidoreductase (luciferase family)